VTTVVEKADKTVVPRVAYWVDETAAWWADLKVA
jgi:hypothetical protein